MEQEPDKYIKIKNLSNLEKAFESVDDVFTDIMYADHIAEDGVVMLLDVNIDPEKEEDLIWLKGLLGEELYEIGEKEFFLVPFYL